MSPSNPTVLIAAGGTGGHIFPGLATADALKTINPELNVEFVGTADRMEATLVPEAGYTLHTVQAMALPRKTDPKIFKLPFVLGKSVGDVRKLIQDRKVIAACGFGGYTSVSLGLAAKTTGVPLVIHEQNAVPGVTNRLLAPLATRVVGTFEETMMALRKPRSGAIGNPVRTSFAQAIAQGAQEDRQHLYTQFGLDPNRQTILVFGGSQGAAAINASIIEASTHLANPEAIQIIHATGEKQYEANAQRWAQEQPGGLITSLHPFISNMADALQIADVVVCRSGASTLAELTVLGLPAILVPYPYATGNHQHANARAMVQSGAAKLIDDASLTGEGLADTIKTVIDPQTNAAMREASARLGRPNAAHDLAALLLEIAR